MKSKNHKNISFIKNPLLISSALSLTAFAVNAVIYVLLSELAKQELVSFSSAFVTAATTIYAIITGFTILIAFTRYQSLNNIVNEELACLGDILDFTTYLEDNNLKIRIVETLKEYGVSISNDEWARMLDRKPHPKTSLYLEKIMQLINQIPAGEGEKNSIIFEAFINRIKDLTTFRANRLKEASEPFPKLLMTTLYTISIIFVLSIFLLFTPNFIIQSIFVISSVFVATLVIQLINDIGNPYKPGVWYVSKEAYENIPTSIVSQTRQKAPSEF